MTTNFYAPPSSFRASRVVLPDAESRHAQTVLRVERGDEIRVVDGEGGWYRVQVDRAESDQLIGSVLEQRSEVGEPSIEVTVAIGILKKRSRFETFVEKAVELGVRTIVPLQTQRTERDSIRSDRLEKIMVAAMKQCRRSRLPELARPTELSEVLEEGRSGARFICDSGPEATPIGRAARSVESAESALILVGPEGGFADSEICDAVDSGCDPVSLGRRRLRTETAGMAALHTVVAAARAAS